MTHTLRKRKTACLPVCRKERSMDNKLKFQQLECYKLATDEQKEKLNKEQYLIWINCRKTSFRQNLRIHLLPWNAGIHPDHKKGKALF